MKKTGIDHDIQDLATWTPLPLDTTVNFVHMAFDEVGPLQYYATALTLLPDGLTVGFLSPLDMSAPDVLLNLLVELRTVGTAFIFLGTPQRLIMPSVMATIEHNSQ